MKTIAFCIISALSLPATVLAAGDIAAGQSKSTVCSACHGADGNSTNPDWPKLAGQHSAYTEKQLHDLKAGKVRSDALMAGIVATLEPQDMADLAAYYAAQSPSGGFVSEQRRALGEKIYRGGVRDIGVPACMSCHGPAGAGNPLGGFPKLSGQHAKYVAKQLDDFKAGARSNDSQSMMRDVVRLMSDEQIAAVAEYVSGLH